MTAWERGDFFQTGGALEADAPSYITRQADQELRQAVLSEEYCNVLTTRQMGKSSLMIRTVSHLQSQGVRTVIIDLTLIGTEISKISASEWYFGLVSQFKRELNLGLDEMAWWTKHQQLSPVQRFSDFLRQVVLVEVQEPIVVFIDEIDTTLNLPFTDDFFAAIRATYNARASDPACKRLTFVLLGVARPADLIKKRTRTPYNIGTSIDLRDFTPEEARTLLAGLQAAHPQYAEAILARVLYWTNGHPYLTQKVCAEVVAGDGYWTDERIDRLVERLFLAQEMEKARKETNLQFIRERIRKSRERADMLRVYGRVQAGKRVKDEERSVAKSQLKLSGLVKATAGGELIVRNRIYKHVFDTEWVKENMPVLRARWVAIVAVVIAVLAVLVLGYLIYRERTLPNSIKAEQFITGFQSAINPEVRLNNLANLFRLEGYGDQARDLFFGLSAVERLRLFVGLSDPRQVGADVLTVAEETYQDRRLENDAEYNQLLQAIAGVLHQVEGDSAPGAQVMALEIDYWLAGRNKTLANDFEAAVKQYDLALGLKEDNPGVLFDRGMAYTRLREYPKALADLQAAVELDRKREETVGQSIWQDSELFTYLGQHRPEYAIAALFPTLTPTPIPPTPTPTHTPTHTPTPTPAHTPTHTPTPTPTPTYTPIPPSGLINDFELPTTWKRGDQPNGTFERSAEQAYQSNYAGKLNYQFSSANNDFVVFLPIPEPVLSGQPNQFTAWVYGDSSGNFLNVWIRDREGERWQFLFGRINHTGWKQMAAYLDPNQPWPASHIDGSDNGVIDYPIRFAGLVVDDATDSQTGSGTIYIDDLTSGRINLPSTSVPPAISISFRADRTTLDAGECTWLRWDVENVSAVYVEGGGVYGHGSREVCPAATTIYRLHVILRDGSSVDRAVTITVQ